MSLARSFPLVLALVAIACGDEEPATKDTSTSGDATTTSGDTTSTATTATTTDATTTPDTTGVCNPVAQTGCADNQNCTFVGNETTATCQTKGAVPPEEPCGGENRCELGVCLNLNQTESLCYQFCAVDADCGADAAAGACLTLSNAPFKICKIAGIYENCNLLTQDCDQTEKSCYAVANENDPICLVTGTKTVGNACDRASDCVRGLACVNDVCRSLCDPEATTPCGAEFECNPFFANAGYCEPK